MPRRQRQRQAAGHMAESRVGPPFNSFAST